MAKEIISKKQGIVIVFLYAIGDTLLVLTGLEAKKDVWLAILIALISGVLLMYVCGSILSSYRGKDLYEISEILFGKTLGKIICLIYIWYSLHLGALVLRTSIEFINTMGLEETPAIIPGICLIVLCAWIAKEGIEVVGRWSEFFLLWFLLTFIFLFVLSLSLFDITKLQPMLYEGVKPVIRGAFSAFAFPFGELVIFLMIFDSIDKKNSPTKILITGIILGGLYIVYLAARDVSILGIGMVMNDYFPTYTAISRINVGNFLQRLEIAVSLVFLIGIFIKLSLCIIAACKGVARLFSMEDYRFIVVPISLLMLNLSSFVYENIIELSKVPSKIWPYYSLPFQVILPVVIFVVIKFKKRPIK